MQQAPSKQPLGHNMLSSVDALPRASCTDTNNRALQTSSQQVLLADACIRTMSPTLEYMQDNQRAYLLARGLLPAALQTPHLALQGRQTAWQGNGQSAGHTAGVLRDVLTAHVLAPTQMISCGTAIRYVLWPGRQHALKTLTGAPPPPVTSQCCAHWPFNNFGVSEKPQSPALPRHRQHTHQHG